MYGGFALLPHSLLGILIENGKVEKLKVRQLDLYLKEHGLTTVGIKPDMIKAIRYHYYRQKKSRQWKMSRPAVRKRVKNQIQS